MSENIRSELATLAIDALDNLGKILDYQQLLEIAVDQLDDSEYSSTKTANRVNILLESYLCLSEPWVQNLEMGLKTLVNLAAIETLSSSKEQND